MAKFNYEELEQIQQATSSNKEDKAKVGYFNSLKNDGDEAIVRFVYSNPSQFDLTVVHKVKVGDFYRYISCLRTGLDSVDKCPLCAKEEKVNSRFFVKMLEYSRDEKGNIVAKPVVWDRPAKFSKYIKGLIDEYGDLSSMIFKIKRRGAKGDMQTTYDCYPANQNVYKESQYVKDFSAFETLDLAHHSYYDLTFDEIQYYMNTGEIPQREKPQDNTQSQNNVSPNATYNNGVNNVPPYQAQQNVQQNQYNNVQQAVNNVAQAEQNPYPNNNVQTGQTSPQQTQRRQYTY